MVGEAIQRELSRSMDRVAIGSLTDLKRAYEEELAEHGTEIAAQVDKTLAFQRETFQRIRTNGIHKHRCCAKCGGPIEGARRFSRRFCSDRCRQRAHRKRRRPAA
jgi:predicted nucleic acid-binding Zn ribbon protein